MSEEPTMAEPAAVAVSDAFEEWRRLNQRRQKALRGGLCTCCAFIIRAGVPESAKIPAVCEWITRANNRELLCASCLGHWQANAADDPELAPASLVMLSAAGGPEGAS